MNIVRLILLTCQAFFASILLIANPVYAASATQMITVVSAPAIPELVTPNLTQQSNPITDQVGCNCANCVQTKFQVLQGKLPSVGF